jgi:chromosome segregation ATPase
MFSTAFLLHASFITARHGGDSMTSFLNEEFLNEDPLVRYRSEHDEQQAELARQRRREERERQRTEVRQVAIAPDDYWAEVDRRIEEKLNVILEAAGEAIGKLLDKQHESLQSALDRRDRAIQALRDEIEIKIGLGRKLARFKTELDQARQQARERELESLQRELGTLRNEIELKLNLKSELAAARTEVEELRQRAPSFKAELEDLREQVAKQKKTISRLRTEHSILEYQQKRLDAEQQKNRQQVALTVTQMTASIGAQTREILHRLQENGFDLWEMESPGG